MSIIATVEHGAIKLPPGARLPEGARVRIELAPPAEAGALAWMQEFAGCIDTLPADAAARHTERAHGRKRRLPA